MSKISIFISSVQSEFSSERQMLYEYLLSDPLLGRFFDPFIFENLPAVDQRSDDIYLNEVERCQVYLAILGKNYGSEDKEGISPTEREFDHATGLHKTRLVFLTAHSSKNRQEKQNEFIAKVQEVLVRKRFSTIDELKSAVYASLVRYLIEREIIRTGPFDASINQPANINDIDDQKVIDFVRVSQAKRGFPLSETTPKDVILEHLNLIVEDRVTNAAILLFGKKPQQYFISSEVRCTHFHGTIVEKPIPSYKVFKGNVFAIVDQAVDFVLSKLDYTVGTRSKDTSIPGKYEIPREIVTEAIVNAVAHRDYTSNRQYSGHAFPGST